MCKNSVFLSLLNLGLFFYKIYLWGCFLFLFLFFLGVMDRSNGGLNYIEHPVSKFDTLAGVAIRYGVEVADIKRINGLVSDLQMFALKTLHIPLPGRHPPSPILSNGQDTRGPSSSGQTSSSRRHSDLFDSFQSLKLKSSPMKPKVSPAMNTLQGYYGLKLADKKAASEGFEMAVYSRKGGSSQFLQNMNPPLSLHRRSKSVANGFITENGDPMSPGDNGSDKWFEKLVRRRQKSETDFTLTPESSGGGFSAVAVNKGLALRPKSANRDSEVGSVSPFPINLGVDSTVNDNSSVVRKSSSTSNLQDSDNNGTTLSSLWNLKTTTCIPKPITGRRNKAALD